MLMPALLLLAFASGGCALAYQIGWLRELRLVFGASTYASAAVLAVFMGGLGFGGAVLGRCADRQGRPLLLYARLEFGIAAVALASPLLFMAIREIYLGTGGSEVLGQPLALLVRLLLSTLVLGLPTLLMGGTLPALAAAAESREDSRRRRTAQLYGLNTLGAVSGALAATFFLLERLGTRRTILAAVAVNFAVAAAAFALSRRGNARHTSHSSAAPVERGVRDAEEGLAPARIAVLGAAALAGFVFFLMEIVWYRMLAPLLGGSTYTHGLVIAAALLGIGAGGLLFSVSGRWVRPTAGLFAAVCGFQAAGLALAFALGDRLALLAMQLRAGGVSGLPSLVGGWALVCAIVVVPSALAAGFQFPLLIALLGRGGDRVGRDVGAVYVWNSVGSILGSLGGGFGLLPLLGALSCWRLAVAMLIGLCVAAVVIAARDAGRWRPLAATTALPVAAAVMIAAPGPSAAWRHSPIGAGGILADHSPNAVRGWLNFQRVILLWETDGIESSVALQSADALSLVVNGKVDGNARGDAGTQIMGPLIGAILHPAPRTALVIGLGTGSSAGWLGAIDSVERVDVAELEPAVVEVARQCAPVNRDVLANPKVRIAFGDGRELLMTSRGRYDLIFSEPSNPYRAGIAALYTREFYEAVAARLAAGGIFSQWLQGYGVESSTVRTVAATLASVFGDVETWRTNAGDLLFVCSSQPKDYDLPRLRSRLAAEPYRSAMLAAWGVTGVEGLLSGYLASDAFARHVLARTPGAAINTDDRSPVEFGFIKAGVGDFFPFAAFRRDTRARGADRPPVRGGVIDGALVDRAEALVGAWRGNWDDQAPAGSVEERYRAYVSGDFGRVTAAGGEKLREPLEPFEAAMLAEALAEAGDERARSFLPRVADVWPAAAAAIEARLLARQGRGDGACGALERAFAGFRKSPWDPLPIARRALGLSLELAERQPRLSQRIYDLLAQPFSVRNLEMERVTTLVNVAMLVDCSHGERALARLEPNIFWDEPLLRYRAECYVQTGNPRAAVARLELEEFMRRAGTPARRERR